MADDGSSQVEPVSVEPVALPEAVPSEPARPVSEQVAPETPTAQIPASEPLPPQPEPIAPPRNQTPQPTSPPNTTNFARDLLVKARATIQSRKAKKLEKILEALNAKGPTTLKLRRAGEISNDEVEKLLHVSDATATRYLSALEKQGKVKQVGKTGHAVTYTKS